MAFQSEISKGLRAGTSISPEAIDRNSSVFPSDSAIWRISREHVLLLGGAAAAILQIAHPQVALGVAAHSDFRNDTLGRLHRTLEAVYTISFAPRSSVEAMAAAVRASHARVQGDAPQKYSAFSRDAQMWVLATLIQLSVEMHERFIGPLDLPVREAYFRDMKVFGIYFGLPVEYGPQNWAEFAEYYQGMLEGDELCSLPLSRELAHHVAYPRKPGILKLLWPLSGAVAREFLPPVIGERLGLPRTPASSLTVAMLDAVLPGIWKTLPPSLRFATQYRDAVKRLDQGSRA